MKAVRFILLLLFILLGSISMDAFSQRSVVVYQDRQLPADAKAAIREMAGLLGKSRGLAVRIDSVNSFTGKGIYFTIPSVDRYRKAPATLRQKGEEGIYILANTNMVYSVANSSAAVSNAIFTYLDKVGYRFYFPDPAWHIIPANPNLFEPMNLLEEPDFDFRSIFMGWGYGSDKLRDRYNFWERANRMGGSLQVRAEHSYLKLIAAKKKEFEKNPAFLTKPLLNGQKQSKTAFNFASKGLVNLAHEWLAELFDKEKKAGKTTPMLSLEAFDGPNYCDLPECQKLGANSSDQFFYFTNQVAKKLKQTHPGKLIGVLAYNDHIDIPKYPVEDNIFVTLTSAYNPSAYSTDQLIQRWKTKVKRMGMYDYIGLFTSTYELPGRGLAGNYNNQAIIMKKYHDQHIVSYQAESTYGWIPKGISQYLVSRLAWDAKQPIQPVIDRFYRDLFPQTEKFIRPMFESWAQPFILTENDIYTWLTAVKNAFAATKDPAEIERIHQIALYLRYVTLFKAYDDVKSDAVKSKTAGADLLAYMNAILETGVVASYAGINTLAPTLGADFAYNNKSAIWKNRKVSVPATPADWNRWFANYLPGLQKMSTTAKYDTAPFVTKEELANLSRKFTVANKTQEVSFNGSLIVIADTKESDSLFLNVRGGRIKNAGFVSVTVYPWNNEMKPEGKKLLTARFPANSKYNKVNLAGLERGRYVIHVADSNSSGAHVYFPRKLRYSILATQQYPVRYAFYNNYYIYVPPETKVFYITKTHYLQLFDPTGKKSAYATQESKLVEVKVDKGKHGWWRVQMQLRDIYFTGIPPLLSRDPESFFLPD